MASGCCVCCSTAKRRCYTSAIYSMGYHLLVIGTLYATAGQPAVTTPTNTNVPTNNISDVKSNTSITAIIDDGYDGGAGHPNMHRDHFPFVTSLEQVMMVLSLLGLLTSTLLIVGLKTSNSMLLLPWLVTFGGLVAVDIIYIPYTFYHVLKLQQVTPEVALVQTLNLLALLGNMLCFWCVYSQFRSYCCPGWGSAETRRDSTFAAQPVLYSAPRSRGMNGSVSFKESATCSQQAALQNKLLQEHPSCLDDSGCNGPPGAGEKENTSPLDGRNLVMGKGKAGEGKAGEGTVWGSRQGNTQETSLSEIGESRKGSIKSEQGFEEEYRRLSMEVDSNSDAPILNSLPTN